MRLHECIRTYTCTRTQTHMHTYTQKYIHTYTHTHSCTHTRAHAHTHTYACICTRMHRQKPPVTTPQRVKQYHRRIHASVHTRIHVHTYIHTHTRAQPTVSASQMCTLGETHLWNVHTLPCTGAQNTCFKVHVTLTAGCEHTRPCIYACTCMHMHMGAYARPRHRLTRWGVIIPANTSLWLFLWLFLWWFLWLLTVIIPANTSHVLMNRDLKWLSHLWETFVISNYV